STHCVVKPSESNCTRRMSATRRTPAWLVVPLLMSTSRISNARASLLCASTERTSERSVDESGELFADWAAAAGTMWAATRSAPAVSAATIREQYGMRMGRMYDIGRVCAARSRASFVSRRHDAGILDHQNYRARRRP